MFSRITLFEIDVLRISVDAALKQFKELIAPEMRKQGGYEGAYVMTTPDGKGLVMTLWASKEAAVASEESGYYDAQIAKFVSLFRAPAGRDHYEVILADPPKAGV
ncbi:MAG: hypothetical protein HN929_00950 [Chloroflexi bacterium]|mgnify:CR=1 FL=1|jgi:hypothetical protein|nr:hypothetical protein [Chloroflexota bacterium]MBT7080032.1 hypothetical protein [Chloroflexota bacterium]MBT7289894.1 hypothetical protein [Chloroflexota bacterium]